MVARNESDGQIFLVGSLGYFTLGGRGQFPARPQIFFVIIFVRDAAEQQNLMNFPKFNRKYDFKYENDNFLP